GRRRLCGADSLDPAAPRRAVEHPRGGRAALRAATLGRARAAPPLPCRRGGGIRRRTCRPGRSGGARRRRAHRIRPPGAGAGRAHGARRGRDRAGARPAAVVLPGRGRAGARRGGEAGVAGEPQHHAATAPAGRGARAARDRRRAPRRRAPSGQGQRSRRAASPDRAHHVTPPSQSDSLVDALAGIVGARHVRTALPERMTYARDGLPTHRRVPGVVVLPGQRDEVIAVVRLLATLGVPLVPRGAGPGLSGVELGSPGGEPWGPDLVGLFVGSEGNFGIATRITVRLLPVPRAIRTQLADFDSLRTAGEAVSAVIASGIVPAALEMMDQSCIRAVEDSVYAAGYPRDAAAVLLAELDGAHEAAVAADGATIEAVLRAHGARSVLVAA